VTELARAVRAGPGRTRHAHLVLENDRNEARYLARDANQRALVANAQWSDDFHHALHIIATGERDGYYADYAQRPLWYLGRTLAEGLLTGAKCRTAAACRAAKRRRLPASAFVIFGQTHDQTGNRALGDACAIAHLPALRPGMCSAGAPGADAVHGRVCRLAVSIFLRFRARARRRRATAAAMSSPRSKNRQRRRQMTIPDPNAEATFHEETAVG
jgi:hypothetical protein